MGGPLFFPSMSKFGPYPESMRHPLGNKLFVLSILVFIEIKDTGKSLFSPQNVKPMINRRCMSLCYCRAAWRLEGGASDNLPMRK